MPVLSLALLAVQAPVPVPPPAPAAPALVEGRVLVKLRPGAALPRGDYPEVLAEGRALPAPRGRDRVGIARILALDVAPAEAERVRERLSRESWVEWVERPSAAPALTSLVPDETAFLVQWALHQVVGPDMDMPEAWMMRGGFAPSPDLLVGVCDTGFPVATTVPDMAGLAVARAGELANGLDDDGNGFVDDLHGWDFVQNDADPAGANPHGFLVSSVLAARAGNGSGIAGVASGASLLHARIIDDAGQFPATGPWAGQAAPAAGIVYLTDCGVDLINNSWTDHGGPTQILLDAIDYAADNGVHVFFAAANDAKTTATPADHPRVTAVAALQSNGWKAWFSNWGPWVDLCSGGMFVSVLEPTGQVSNSLGTSLSCPLVAGVAAHVLSEDRDLSVADLRAILMQGAVSVDALNLAYAGGLGAGMANARRSLLLLQPFEDLGHALAGSSAPVLNGWGGTHLGDSLTVSVSRAEPVSLGILAIGFSRVDLPALSGVLVPSPDLVSLFATSAAGEWKRVFPLIDDVGAGVEVWVQALVADAGAPEAWSFTNAVSITGQ